jgi:hypothetical protein
MSPKQVRAKNCRVERLISYFRLLSSVPPSCRSLATRSCVTPSNACLRLYPPILSIPLSTTLVSSFESVYLSQCKSTKRYSTDNKPPTTIRYIALTGTESYPQSSNQQQQQLYKAGELFDPSEEQLRSLLDDSFFPAKSFQQEDVLTFLRSIGLQNTLGWTGVIACARSIESTPNSPDHAESKRLRGGSLLRFLDRNIRSLLDEAKPKKSTEAAKKVDNNGYSLSLFRGWASSMLGVADETTTSTTNNISVSSNSGERSPEEIMQMQIEQLVVIAWMPVLQLPVDPLMPWAVATGVIVGKAVGGASVTKAITTASAITTLTATVVNALGSPCASPCDCAPLADAWLCSASRRIVDAPVYSPGEVIVGVV